MGEILEEHELGGAGGRKAPASYSRALHYPVKTLSAEKKTGVSQEKCKCSWALLAILEQWRLPLLRLSVLCPDMLFTGLAGWGRQAWDWAGRASSVGPTAVSACGLSSGEGTVGGGDGGTGRHQLELSRGGEQQGLL